MANPPTNIPAPRVGFIDPRTGLMAREWYRFFFQQFEQVGGGAGLTHNVLTGLQGGAGGNYYHLGLTDYTGNGTGTLVRSTSAALVTPALGTPSSGVITSCTGSPTLVITNCTGSPTLTAPLLGTPASGIITNCTGSPTLTAPLLGTPASGDISNCTGSPTLTALTATGNIRITGAGSLGYSTGSGGAVTQLTSKTTGVTLNKSNGKITMEATTAIPASNAVVFTLTNSFIAVTDAVIANIATGGTANAYTVDVLTVAVGSVGIRVVNISAGSLSEAVVVSFAIIKAVAA
jgi:hypothetical protein